ncbi:MAG: hypothetical protein ACYDBV_02580, partial [Nitrospiria bacterium]
EYMEARDNAIMNANQYEKELREKRPDNTEQDKKDFALAATVTLSWAYSKCIASDDPRLK